MTTPLLSIHLLAAYGRLVTSKTYNILEFNDVYGQYYGHDGKVTKLINVFIVQPKDQQRLIDLLIYAIEKVTSQQEEVYVG